MITDKVGGSSAKPEVSKQSKEKRLKHKVSGYKSQSKRQSIAGCRLLLRTLEHSVHSIHAVLCILYFRHHSSVSKTKSKFKIIMYSSALLIWNMLLDIPLFYVFFSQTQLIYDVYHDSIFHLKALLHHFRFKPHSTDSPLTFKMFDIVRCRGLVQCNLFYNRRWLVNLSSFLLNSMFQNNNYYCFVNQALHCLWCRKALSNKVHKHFA